MFHERALEHVQTDQSYFQNLPNFRGVMLTNQTNISHTNNVYNIVYQGRESNTPNLENVIRQVHKITGTTSASDIPRQTPSRITTVSEPITPITTAAVTPVEVSEPVVRNPAKCKYQKKVYSSKDRTFRSKRNINYN